MREIQPESAGDDFHEEKIAARVLEKRAFGNKSFLREGPRQWKT